MRVRRAPEHDYNVRLPRFGSATLLARQPYDDLAPTMRTDILLCRCERTKRRFVHPVVLRGPVKTNSVRFAWCRHCLAEHTLILRDNRP